MRKKVSTTHLATFFGVMSLALWSFSSLCNYLLTDIPAFEILTVIAFISCLSANFLSTIRKGEASVRVQKIHWPSTLFCGLMLFINESFYILALKIAPAAHIDIIIATWPILVILLSILIGEKVQTRYWIGIGLGFLTTALLVNDQSTVITYTHHYSWTGYLFAILGSLAAASYTISIRYQPQQDVLSTVGIFAIICTVLAFLAHMMFEQFVMPSSGQLITMFFMGIMTHCVAYTLWNYGVSKGNYKVLCVTSYMAPIASVSLLCLFNLSIPTIELYFSVIIMSAACVLCMVPGTNN